MPSRVPPRTQLALDLDRPLPPSPTLVPEEAVSALADLLLTALGHGVLASGTESGDEPQDHR
jgi:hypothetical protein